MGSFELCSIISKTPRVLHFSAFHCKIKAFKTTLMEPLLLDSEKNTTEDNVRPIDDMFEHFSGSEFQKHLLQCKEHSLLTERQISDAQKAYLLVLGKTIEHRFPKLNFMTEQLSFIDPPQIKLHQCDTSMIIVMIKVYLLARQLCTSNTEPTAMTQH